jgi:putative ABC transport system permease protein
MVERLVQDIRYAARTLRRNVGFAASTLGTLALAIGVTTATFSVVRGVLLRPLPFGAPDRLMMIAEQWQPRFAHFEATPHDVAAWRKHSQSFESIGAFVAWAFNVTANDAPERLQGARISWNLLSVLGVQPMIGRGFTPEEDRDGNHFVALVSHGLWQRMFGGRTDIVGQRLKLSGADFTIVGVMPPGFRFPVEADIWRPMAFTARDLQGTNHFIWGIGRLKAGVVPSQAQDELTRIMNATEKQVWSASVYPLIDYYVGSVRPALGVLFGAVILVLLIACANVANLLLARAAGRQREVALRASLGATRSRMIQQLFTESMLLAIVGGAAGCGLAVLGIEVLRDVAPAGLPRIADVTFDYTVLLFALGLTAGASVLFGLTPALHLSGRVSAAGMRHEGTSTRMAVRLHARRLLVVSEVALALMLLIAAGLLTKSMWRLLQVDPGFQSGQVVAGGLFLPPLIYRQPQAQTDFVGRLLERVRRAPGTEEVAVSTAMPLMNVTDVGIRFDGRAQGAETGTTAQYYRVTPGYVRAMRVPVTRGRFFDEHDVAGGRPVVVINETMARRFFPNEDPIGKRLDISGPTFLREIVGVVGDVRQQGLDIAAVPQVYEPFMQAASAVFTVVVRTTGDPAVAAAELRRAVHEIDKTLPLSPLRAMDDVIGRSVAPRRFSVLGLSAFTVFAVALAAIGVYGLIAYMVAQRTHEFAIRMAVGARPREILALVAGESVRVVVIGVAVGLIGSWGLTRFLASLLYGVRSTDPQVLVLVSAGLAVLGLAAALVPARRATRVAPLAALRAE